MSPGRRVRDADVVRRRRTPRFDAVSALAVVIPLVAVGAIALVQKPPVHDNTHAPALTRLTGATVVCPTPESFAPEAWVSTASGASGDVTIGTGSDTTTVSVSPESLTPLTGTGPTVVQGSDALAPGLLGLRAGASPLTTEDCGVPSSGQWYAGVGAGPAHDSVIELVNPDSGPADADIALYGSRSFTRPQLHGITIPAHRTVRLDLGKIAPKRQLLSAQVQVTRGRLAVHVIDSRTDLVSHKTVREWLPRQAAPGLDIELLGLPPGKGSRTLQLANPGDDVARAQVKIVTGDTTFAPAGLKTVTIRPGSTETVPLTKVLAKALDDGAVGVQVTADAPVVASVLTDLGTDTAVTVPDSTIHHEAATLLPVASGKGATPVTATLYVSADAAGAATVQAYGASGKQLLDQRVGQQQGHTVAVKLPKGTAFLRVTPENTDIRASVVLTGDGASVIPLHELLTEGLVPHIQPD
jgi:Family of unknown function (DUF5719)